jgi:hypothetical protein
MHVGHKSVYISYNLVTKEHRPTVIPWGEFVTRQLSSFFSTEAHKFKDGQEVEIIVTQWMTTQNTNKCLTCHRDYMEKKWDNSTIKYALSFLEMKIKNLKDMHCKLIFWLSQTIHSK